MSDARLTYGPYFQQFLTECWADRPATFGVAWATAALAIVAVVGINHAHESELRQAPVSIRQQYYLRITAMARVFALTAGMSLVAPRSWLLWFLLQKQYEAYVLATFGHLLFALLHLSSLDEAASVEAGAAPPEHGAAALLRFLNSQGPRHHFAVPPRLFGPAAARCARPHLLSSRHLLGVFRCLRQFVVLTPALAVVRLWAALAIEEARRYEAVERALVVCGKLSTGLALYALLVLYFATHDLLLRWRTTAKFVAVKALLIVALLQEPLIGWLAGWAEARGSHPPSSQRCLHGEGLARFWGQWALAIESVCMAVLMAAAFKPDELSGRARAEAGSAHAGEADGLLADNGGLLVELELMRFESRRPSTARPLAVSVSPLSQLASRAAPAADAYASLQDGGCRPDTAEPGGASEAAEDGCWSDADGVPAADAPLQTTDRR